MTLRLPPTDDGIAEAAHLLRAGKLVAFPTETVFGLGADAADPAAVARLYAAKGRPAFNPLIAHVATPDQARHLADLPSAADALIERFWPGPLTLVAPIRDPIAVCELARAGLDTVGLRCPSHPVARALLKRVDRPVVAPSANRSGHISPTKAAHVLADLDGRIDAVLDGESPNVGLESTIISFLGDEAVMLRPGGVPRDAIARLLPVVDLQQGTDRRPLSPGRLASHYAPHARMRLDADHIDAGEAVLDFGRQLHGRGVMRIDLSETGNLVEAAARLYDALRTLDGSGAAIIAVAPIPGHGLGEAIRDRLSRAAAPRDTGRSADV
jgi:L-threonylcarbamoyladenylate synthase